MLGRRCVFVMCGRFEESALLGFAMHPDGSWELGGGCAALVPHAASMREVRRAMGGSAHSCRGVAGLCLDCRAALPRSQGARGTAAHSDIGLPEDLVAAVREATAANTGHIVTGDLRTIGHDRDTAPVVQRRRGARLRGHNLHMRGGRPACHDGVSVTDSHTCAILTTHRLGVPQLGEQRATVGGIDCSHSLCQPRPTLAPGIFEIFLFHRTLGNIEIGQGGLK